ncbi:hypothetical protein Trydic_g23981 [Trypoxylus dichotomus]
MTVCLHDEEGLEVIQELAQDDDSVDVQDTEFAESTWRRSYLMEPTDSEFFDFYNKYVASAWFAVIFLLCILPDFCVSLYDSALEETMDIQITCLVPELITKMQWNISAVRNLTMPDMGRPCTYVDYNYSLFHGMDPEEAAIIKTQIDEGLKQRGEELEIHICAREVDHDEYTFENFSRNFLMTCAGYDYIGEAEDVAQITEIVGFLLMDFHPMAHSSAMSELQ